MGLNINFKELSKEYLVSLRFQLAIFTLVGFAVSESINVTYVESFKNKADETYSKIPGLNGMSRDKANKIEQYVLGVFDTLLFGFGISFLIAAGTRVFEIKNKLLKKRMIGSWIAISFFCISWWPHSTAHNLIMLSSKDPTDNFIIMEVCFHWTLMACACFLSYFQYDLMKLMYEVVMMRKKMASGKDSNPLYGSFKKNINVHGFLISLVLFAVCMVLMFILNPIDKNLKTYQKFFHITFHIVDSALSSLGFGFAYIMIRIITHLPSNKGRTVAIVSTVCIWFNFMIQVPHPLVHLKAPLTMDSLLIIDYCVHIPIMVTTGILAFYQFRMLELATDKKSTLAIATRMRKGSKSISQNTFGESKASASLTASHGALGNSAMGDSKGLDISIEMNELDASKEHRDIIESSVEGSSNSGATPPSIEEIVVAQEISGPIDLD
ncbi:hypothetical protein PPL_06163 [Heterostelium album PN500]|uniref:Uncharacterized protein n=1 Tax=Heterostelium pallidum (strain ATCC 26659 / Pp 5 / PN500) TaxID=670386 RepID=D3BCD8_HETP5|nr:hypothetical protein PPL_06163 [Heterostelium album PN500]EFA80928.1 hypothetical protein PPL_06163 [Heterostelium album PN500]|eukprot:XP_020433046.1 hypothetical protein PPL_06163 [Heterostelium album PN500]